MDRTLRAFAPAHVRPRPDAPELDLRPGDGQIQSASMDLRLGPRALRMRAGFLPGRAPLSERLEELATHEIDLRDHAILERGVVYLIPLDEELDLPEGVHGRFNPRSSTGRCDIFTRVLVPGHPRFNETPSGYRGDLWIEVASLSFPLRLTRGDRLCQMRLATGDARVGREELLARHESTPLFFADGAPLQGKKVRIDREGNVQLHLGLAGRNPAGWRAREHTPILHFGAERGHERSDFFEPVRAQRGHCILSPGGFYIFASRERVCVPPDLAAEMQPVDVEIGELRNNYAGFFDNGFGWDPRAPSGTPAVLEVRAHDVPFLAEDGQVFFRLSYFRAESRPERIYGEGRVGSSYTGQDLTLARAFR